MGRDGKIKDVDPNKANMTIGGLDIKGEGGILGLLKSLFQKGNTDKPVGGMDLDKLLTLILTSIGIPLTGGPKGSFNLKDKLKLLGGKKETSGEDSNLKDFASVTNRIIDKFEGGYWNGPTNDNLNKNKSGVCNDHPAKGMGRSTETLFGLDRYHGRIEKTDAGKKFFKIIDDEKEKLGMNNFCKKWKHYYRGGELEQKLKDLAVKIMEERYEENMKNYVDDPETKKIIESDPGLLLHMSYATWNGNLFFKTFAESLEKAVKQGKRGKDLIDVAIHDRYDTPKTIGRTLNHPDRHEAEIKKASIYV